MSVLHTRGDDMEAVRYKSLEFKREEWVIDSIWEMFKKTNIFKP